ncbi:hypothetical protein A2765_00185 [Candidatus Kaiserbacteria bacterium RIFCSPHIGHO2_01_FULL_56_24]|uniref:ribose-phosphate diphosphokinase n=1 Tax=Candidatus Kaiserbacteria bacterium RIFCSPHIGHO2_01_FULL_56_24 TaxID=1798487 RepID=A0A1F6D9F8_9BACT|nr:MAG: hypothetical protein A2765_00185 [Candidatus Kaiserbacteria bacterium RIFCSPHIGHO2_01_FULL_56_24]
MEAMASNILYLINKQARKDDVPAFEPAKMSVKGFANGECEPELLETVRGAHVYLLHPMQLPDPNTALVNLHIIKDALMRAAVGKVTLVLPYLSFMRQDRRKDGARVPISAKAIANLIQPGVQQLITMDLHADQEVGFFEIPVDNIPGSTVLIDDLKHRLGGDLKTVTVVAPDVGSAARVRRIARKLGVPMAIIDKDRRAPGEAEVLGLYGRVDYRRVVLFDDMIDSGGTIISAAKAMLEHRAHSVEIYATHGLLTGEATKKFAQAGIPVRITNSIPRSEEYRTAHADWLTYVSIDQLLAEAIYQTTRIRGSVSKLSV